MNDESKTLFERADQAIAKSRSLIEENWSYSAQAQAWLRRFYRVAEESDRAASRKGKVA